MGRPESLRDQHRREAAEAAGAAQFGFVLKVAPNGTLHVLRPFSQHFRRRYPEPGDAGYCLDPRSGRMLYGY
jgi:hypothetical protein